MVCTRYLAQSLACVKKFEGPAHPNSRNAVCRKMSAWVAQYAPLEHFFVDQSSPNYFRPTWKRLRLIKFFSDVRYVDPFRIYSQWKSKVVKNGEKFWTIFFALTNFWCGHCKNCSHIITPASRDVDWKKSHEDTPTNPEVIEAHMLNFRPDF